MGRPKVKESVSQAFRLDKQISDRLSSYSKRSSVPKVKVVEKALDMYLNQFKDTDRVG